MGSGLFTGGPVRLKLVDVGPFGEAVVELRPLTVFVGRNSVGKSFMAQLLWSLAEALPDFATLLGSVYERAARELGGRDVLEEVVGKIRRGEDVSSEVRLFARWLVESLGAGLAKGVEESLANSFGGIDFYVNWIDKQIELYGELFIDDIQGDSDSISQSVQNNIAGMGGVRWDFNKGWYGFIEGGQINSFVYNHISGEKLRYQSKNAFIGSPLGPDQRLLWGKFGYRIKPNLSVDMTGWYRQSGERDINYEYTSVHGTRDDPIPYGTAESEGAGWLTAKYRWRGISAEINGGMTHYNNLNLCFYS